jgi:hypothetical protein
MLRIHATEVPISTGMSGFVCCGWSRSVSKLAHVAGRSTILTVYVDHTTPIGRSGKGPYKAVVFFVRHLRTYPYRARAGRLPTGIFGYVAPFQKTPRVNPAITVAAMRLAAVRDRTYTFGISHLNLFHRFGSARTRRGVPTSGGFAISSLEVAHYQPKGHTK